EVPYVEVDDPRRAAGLLAARLAGDPSAKLVMAGVTGTSGKTTTALLLDRVLAVHHAKRGLFGTLVWRGADGREVQAARTTPEATELQPMLAALAADGGTAVSMECSSHALTLERLAGCAFDVALFLNLSREHLDFHGDMDSYFEAKARLFSLLKPGGKAVVNLADPWGRRLLPRIPGPSRFAFSLEGHAAADVRGRIRAVAPRVSLEVMVAATEQMFELRSPLLGRPNAENLLAAAAAGLALGLPGPEIVRALAQVDRIPGRLERVPNARGLHVLVDYAHKPGALEGVLLTARELAKTTSGRVLVVFGCGGDRDKGKRADMGKIAAMLADDVVVTSDNPRSEHPEAILGDIRAGVQAAGKPATFVVDRREAIAEALRRARPGDVVLIAGKGHETEQVLSDRRVPFDDREVAASLLRGPAGADGGGVA
ncbi:MAG TPA: UDP-N-acetylmuramoyl-L-alanyl-D-glutamate--2,6-diaminopimelate ligase, partial [Thermoanaerobaculia bacterium]|nr:UDP-N-acetylmuramoyl-L-alanyl-D-glutamate--2,6-diaminopimelate ligase [Thermoanaerobaculia bacterium]